MNYEYLNPALSPEERTLNLISQMTLEEKIGQMMQIAYITIPENEANEWVTNRFAGSFLHVIGDKARHLQELALTTRLGIPILFGIDAIHGHAFHNGATIFPTQLAMSCSWNTGLIEKMGRATAKEVAADGIHWTFSPVLCIGRDLRWGRINETFGEDPYLIGELAHAIIRGYQGDNLSDEDSILACAKHYIAYGESTGGRDSYDTEITYRKLKELFLPPFERAVKAGCATFMAGYESIDGIPCSANKKVLKEILKEDLGFNGFVVTDWDNTGSFYKWQHVAKDISEAAKKVIEAGNDMIMNTPDFYDAAIKLVKDGVVPEALIEEATKRILQIKFKMGLFEKCKKINKNESIFSCKENLDVNLELTRESIVLLENKNNTLPLSGNIKKIAVIGPNADDLYSQYGDWTFFSHSKPEFDSVAKPPYYTMLGGIREIAESKGIEVVYHKGCSVMSVNDFDEACEESPFISKDNDVSIVQAVKEAASADVIIAVMGDCILQNGECKDRADLNLSRHQQILLEKLKESGKPLIVILVNGKPLSVPWISKNADALIESFNSGMFGGKAVGEIIFGETNPSGKLSISIPYHVGQLPVYYNQLPGWHGSKYMDIPEEPLYSFGYGLSYSKFEYSNLKLSEKTLANNDVLTVSVDIKNAGDRDGFEIVQLYAADCVSSVITPYKQLKGFKKIFVKSGETERVSIRLHVSELAIVDSNEKYIVEPGEFTVMIGSDSRNISLLKDTFTVIK